MPPMHSVSNGKNYTGHLSHSKIVIASDADCSINENTVFYIGSANFT